MALDRPEFVREHEAPKKISRIDFGLHSPNDIVRLGLFQAINKELYVHPSRQPMPNGVLDRRLGTSDKSASCETCGQKLADCAGHFGYVELKLPVFHIGYFKPVITILQTICKSCAGVLLSDDEKQPLLRRLRNPRLDVMVRRALAKQVTDKAKKCNVCPRCNALNGTVKKVGTLRIIHEIFKIKGSTALHEFQAECATAIDGNAELGDFIKKAQDDLTPLRVLRLFERISHEDVELLDMDPREGRPERLIITKMLVPPVSIRPSVAMDSSQGSNEDDITMKLADIITFNNFLKESMLKGQPAQQLIEQWEMLQLQTAMYINSDLPGVPQQLGALKPIRGFCQRLKGKTGRFRGNLSGKRVDFSSRTVISPDPNLHIHQVAVPFRVAQTLTYPERVCEHNLERLRQLVVNGPDKHPGANFVESVHGNARGGPGGKAFLKYGDRARIASELRVGDIVERHLDNGDIVLFNRQPSLHKLSIMAHEVRVMHGRTFRFNECVCTPYNADFDGDEMNLHVPQTEEARAEARILMSVTENLITPRNGEPLIAATQDFLTAAYLLSRKDTFLDRGQIAMLAAYLSDGTEHIDLPPPAIVKPMQLWTGKQIFGVLMRPNKSYPVLVNLETRARTYAGRDADNREYLFRCPKDGYVVMHNSELLLGTLDKATLGSGSKNNLFHVLMRDFGTRVAADRMGRLARFCSRWLMNVGFSIGISDVQPSVQLNKKRTQLVRDGYVKCDELIQNAQSNQLVPLPGCTPEETLEALLNGELSDLRERAGKLCIAELHYHNAPLIMALCGSKGSNINISQMVACVGQQTVSGKRVPNGFMGRALPHFPVGSKQPPAKGFVMNSFYSGLTPTEFFFHTMGGREGLVDTAVKTAETGYMQRRLMKALEDLAVQYDMTVRNSVGGVVQFTYGDDGLDPAGMESSVDWMNNKADRPIDFHRIMLHVRKSTPVDPRVDVFLTPELLPAAVQKLTGTLMDPSAGVTEQNIAQFRSELLAYFHGSAGSKVLGFLPTMQQLLEQYRPHEAPTMETTAGTSTTATTPRFYPSSQAFRAETVVNRLAGITQRQLEAFFQLAADKFNRAMTEPGTAVGAIGAQSLGEPCTQMTLKTFHFAGVASMNITLGVPRIKEIINANKTISTPLITAQLLVDDDVKVARIVKGRIEKTTLGEVARKIKAVFPRGDFPYIKIKLDTDAIRALQLDITPDRVMDALLAAPKLKIKTSAVSTQGAACVRIRVTMPTATAARSGGTIGGGVDAVRAEAMYHQVHSLKNSLANVIVQGVSTVARAVISEKEKHKGHYELLVEGSDMAAVMATPGVIGTQVRSNNIVEVEKVLGIEAARSTVINEIMYTMGSHGISIDVRHVMLLADLMTFRGELLGITRFGMAKMKDSVLMLASFEKTIDHLFEASVHARADTIEGVSECIIMGIPIPLGTGLFKLLSKVQRPTSLNSRPPLLLDSHADFER